MIKIKIALIMAGGNGSRFWPLSRKNKPKQFLKINSDEKTLLEQTVERINTIIPKEQIFVATNKSYEKAVKEKICCLPEENIILEEVSKNTAPAITMAFLKIKNIYPKSTIFILPSDHLIKREDNFTNLLLKAAEIVEEKNILVTIGIKPEHPETGYGYIKSEKKGLLSNNHEYYQVNEFKEKPDFKTAEKYLEAGNYYWNSGIYIVDSQKLLKEIEKREPSLYNDCKKIMEISDYKNLSEIKDQNIKIKIEKIYNNLEKISIEYSVIEKLKEIYMLKADFIWDDLGSWTSLERVKEKNENNNIIVGEHLGIDTNDSIIYSCSCNKIVTTVGVKNLIIVNTEDAVLICDKEKAQDIKELRKLIENEKLDKYL
ncbi:MAG: mannose-1-phosphate guanylyltransferase [Bacillota bacterium]